MSAFINLYGRPGAGKGTLADVLHDELGWHHLAMGNALKAWAFEENSTEQRELAARLRQGLFASDEQALGFVRSFLADLPASVPGVIFDGFPRTLAQLMMWLDLGIDSTGLLVEISPDQARRRLAERLMCASCGRTQPRMDGSFCRNCSGVLIRRDEDEPDGVVRRMSLHEELVEPTIAAWRSSGQPFEVISNENGMADFQARVIALGRRLMAR